MNMFSFKFKTVLFALSAICFSGYINAQDTALYVKENNWDYKQCVEYAKANNIQLQQSILTKESGIITLEAAKAKWFPTLDASVSQGFTNYPSPVDGATSNRYSGSYGLNAGWIVYDGGNRENSIKRSNIENKINDLAIEEIHNNLETEILSYYLQILYAKEAIGIAKQSLEVSKAQMERAKQLMNAGKMSRVDYSQLESQYNSDLYNLVSAESNYKTNVLNMKRLLELDINTELALDSLSFTTADVLQPIADKYYIYTAALSWMPQFKSSRLQADANDLDIEIAKSNSRPKVSLNGSVGTGNSSGTGYSFGKQLQNSLNEHIGITLSVPIFDNKSSKTAVAKAKIDKLNTLLSRRDLENNLAQSIESTYIEAVNNQAKYRSGLSQLESAEITDELTNEQFKLGLVNTLELLTSHNKLLNARQELLQSKYMAILSIKMLDFYQNKGIALP